MSAKSHSPLLPVLAWLLLAAVLAITAVPVRAQTTFQDDLTRWTTRLEQEVLQIEAQVQAQAQGGQPATRLGPGANIKLRASGPRVGLLAQRLIELGFLAPERRTQVFDTHVDTALRAFQTTQKLNPDGLVGSYTQIALDRTPADSLAALRQTIAVMQEFQKSVPTDIVLVNLPSQTVTLVREGRTLFSMRSAVGRPSRETPLLQDKITHIIVNPTWTVPPTIIKADKLPILRAKGNTGIENAAVYLDGEPVEPEFVDWSQVSPGRVRIVQMPGDRNALGRFRFNLTNSQSIYLHGTNDPQVFTKDLRAVSSGCVRLEDARLMAETLLADAGVTSARIDGLLATGKPQWVKLPKPIPVRFIYWMVTVTPEGAVQYHPDIYGMAGHTAGRAAGAI